jgi:hypothetical protein
MVPATVRCEDYMDGCMHPIYEKITQKIAGVLGSLVRDVEKPVCFSLAAVHIFSPFQQTAFPWAHSSQSRHQKLCAILDCHCEFA